MTKFTEKSLHSYPLAFFYSATHSFDARMAEVESLLERLNTMRQEQHRLFVAFDTAYKNSLKNQLSDTIKKKDEERDHVGYVLFSALGHPCPPGLSAPARHHQPA